ncbi:hypothetical protein GCM10017653_32920 [Ancylobacter defluvii]|uniref:Uncharacterized protein n=1 Tax=Ancylobacter defluvii TaxID=1282440 RepID=A0A9W6JXT1_9HYPH|nr:hypothetical protein GCM10017653_32920 [Ancylobacter defluvii]
MTRASGADSVAAIGAAEAGMARKAEAASAAAAIRREVMRREVWGADAGAAAFGCGVIGFSIRRKSCGAMDACRACRNNVSQVVRAHFRAVPNRIVIGRAGRADSSY